MMAKFSWLDQPEGRVHGCTKQYVEHYYFERNHQGIENQIINSENETLIHSKKAKVKLLEKNVWTIAELLLSQVYLNSFIFSKPHIGVIHLLIK